MRDPAFDVVPARTVLQWSLEDRVFPAAAVEVGTANDVLWRDAVGTLTYDVEAPKATSETVFDLASLTKVIATATVAMRLVDAGILDIEAPVRRWLPAWGAPDREAVTVRDLLEHASGLPALQDLYDTCRGRADYGAALCRIPLSYPPRSRSLYSDLGFMLLGLLLESASAQTLDRLLAEALPTAATGAPPLLTYLPPAGWRSRTAPTRIEDERGRTKPGEVDDTNAWALGGVAGHAGLFGTAEAVGVFAQSILRTLDGAPPSAGGIAQPATLRRFLTRSTVAGSSRALAWDTMLATSSCGTRMSPSAFGHAGFTGTSLWIDPDRGVYIVLLTNRVHPRAVGSDAIQSVRRAFHDAVLDAVAA